MERKYILYNQPVCEIITSEINKLNQVDDFSYLGFSQVKRPGRSEFGKIYVQ